MSEGNPHNHDGLREDIREIKQSLERIDHTLHGNGSPGLKTRVALLERWTSSASKLVWLVIGSAVAAVCSAGVVVFKLVVQGGT